MKKNFIVLILFFSFVLIIRWNNTDAQRVTLDSLIKELKHHPVEDMQQLKILNKLTFFYNWMQYDSAALYADKALVLAKKLNSHNELIEAYNNKAYFLNAINKFNEAIEFSNLAMNENRNKPDISELINSYINLSNSFARAGKDSLCRAVLQRAMQLGALTNNKNGLAQTYLSYSLYYRIFDINNDSALKHLTRSIELFSETNDKRQLSMALLTKGNAFTLISQYDTALIYLKKGLDVAIETGSNVCLFNAYGAISVFLIFGKADYPKAVENLLLSTRYCEKAGEKVLLAYNLNNLSAALQNTGQYEKALFYLDKQLPISLELNDLYSLSGYYVEYGNVRFKQKKFSEALQKYKEALRISLKMNREDRISESSRSVGDAFEKLQQYDSAFYYFKKGMEASKKINSQQDITINLISMARTLKDMPDEFVRGEIKTVVNTVDKNQRAIEYAEDAVKLLKETGEPNLKRDAFQLLSELYQSKNNIPKAYEYYKQYTVYKDSISNTENAKSIANLQMQYETEKKEQQIALLSKDKQIQQTEIDNQKSQRNSVMGGMALMMMIGGVTWNRYRIKQRTNRQLSDALIQLKQTQQQLIEQEKMASLGQLTAGIAHEIQNPLNFVINFSDLGVMLFDEITDNTTLSEDVIADLTENITKIEHHSHRAENIVTSMLLHSRNEGTQKQLVSLSEICNEAINFAQHTATIKYENLKCDITKNIEDIPLINAVYQDFISVVLNLLNNAYYAVNEKRKSIPAYQPEISLEAHHKNNVAVIKVSDNGTGIPNEVKNKIFQPFFTTKDTNEGTGLGLSITNDIVKNHGGEITVQSDPGSFTEFTITLPLT